MQLSATEICVMAALSCQQWSQFYESHHFKRMKKVNCSCYLGVCRDFVAKPVGRFGTTEGGALRSPWLFLVAFLVASAVFAGCGDLV